MRRGAAGVEDECMSASSANILTEVGSLVDTETIGIVAGDEGVATSGATSEFSSTLTSVVCERRRVIIVIVVFRRGGRGFNSLFLLAFNP